VTIDPRVQQAAFDAMSQANRGQGFTGAVVALKPQTGEILAMVSTPSFDPNQLATHDPDAQEKAWTQLRDDPRKPSINRAIGEIYPPGSTFKLVVAAAALENGMDKDTQLTAEPVITLPNTNTQLTNFNSNPCGSGPTASLETALSLSCNTAFAQLAGRLGATKLSQQAAKFGIGRNDLTIPLNVATSSLGPMPDEPSVFQTGIGQRDVLLTPLQDAMVAAAIANGGRVMKPQLVKAILAPDLSSIAGFDADELGRAMSHRNAEILRDMMVKSEQNTAGDGKVAGLTIASKTGTAEHGDRPKLTPPHAWYVAFAPADNPQVTICVLVGSGGDRGLAATGGKVAAGIGRATINAALGGR